MSSFYILKEKNFRNLKNVFYPFLIRNDKHILSIASCDVVMYLNEFITSHIDKQVCLSMWLWLNISRAILLKLLAYQLSSVDHPRLPCQRHRISCFGIPPLIQLPGSGRIALLKKKQSCLISTLIKLLYMYINIYMFSSYDFVSTIFI